VTRTQKWEEKEHRNTAHVTATASPTPKQPRRQREGSEGKNNEEKSEKKDQLRLATGGEMTLPSSSCMRTLFVTVPRKTVQCRLRSHEIERTTVRKKAIQAGGQNSELGE